MMDLYFAPEQYLDRCMDLGIEECCSYAQSYIGIDNVSYRVVADGRQYDVETGEGGEWGLYQEFCSHEGTSPKLCAVHMGFLVPETEMFGRMRDTSCFFISAMGRNPCLLGRKSVRNRRLSQYPTGCPAVGGKKCPGAAAPPEKRIFCPNPQR